MNKDLFSSSEWENLNKKLRLGKAGVEYINAADILTKAKGFVGAYNYTLNPYSGRTFGCNYCYAAFFTRSAFDKENWGNWVRVKENALQLLKRRRKKPLLDKTIYMSSVTDPYQPMEKELELTRSLLQELLDYHDVRLVIQTRSPLVTRDIDLLQKFATLQVNMTITTDSEEVRKAFEPLCPSNAVRLKAITEVTAAGIKTCITMTPLLPVLDMKGFTESLLQTGVNKFVVQPFHADKGKFVAGTRELALEQMRSMHWTDESYNKVVDFFRRSLPWLGEGRDGFAPI